ncbi:hypothetical protein FLONG3_6663 [Fusarium longipes]|uniref:Uncharacterized protein n=1 Tax=Fusarium longipes TaxID=694270 RepID=A0A395SKF5_9HYPO|nr:hypothetical protein FLONG3_6663 [Fusarium longipes]
MANNSSEPLVCGLDANPDLTGLGVRSAFYIQTVSFAIAGKFLDAEAGYLHSSTIGLLLAVFIALLRETIQGSLFAPEVATVMWLFSLLLFASLRTLNKTMPQNGNKVTAGAFLTFRLHMLLVFAYIGYATWFWFTGLDTLPHTDCTEWAFFFAKVNVRGWFRTMNKVLLGISCSICGLVILFTSSVWAFVLMRTPPKQKPVFTVPVETALPFSEVSQFLFDGQTNNMMETPQHISPLKKTGILSSVMFWTAFRAVSFTSIMVASVELQIKWNNFRDVQSLGSVSQLVPFIIALGQFAHIAYSTIRGEDSINKVYWVQDPADGRLWKKVEVKVTTPPCPKRGGGRMDEEQHEMMGAAEGM